MKFTQTPVFPALSLTGQNDQTISFQWQLPIVLTERFHCLLDSVLLDFQSMQQGEIPNEFIMLRVLEITRLNT